MPNLSPIQTGFNRGVISPRMRGAVDSKPYKYGLARCDNWIPTPQGSLFARNAFQEVATELGAPTVLRLLPFKSTTLERFQVALLDGSLQVYNPSGKFGAFANELVVNSECNDGQGGWTFSGNPVARYYTKSPGVGWLEMRHRTGLGPGIDTGATAQQTLAAVPAGAYNLTLTVLRNTWLGSLRLRVKVGTSAGAADLLDAAVVTVSTVTLQFTTVALGSVYLTFQSEIPGSGDDFGVSSSQLDLDDISVRASTGATSTPAPWAAADVGAVQYVCETGRDRMVLVHPGYEPQVLSRNASGLWSLTAISTIGWTRPTDKATHLTPLWSGTNWPGVVEVWQGRLWMAAAPDAKNTFWASRPGTYDFSAVNYNALNAGDGFSYDVAMRGEIRWMQGQKVMLVGCDDGEYSISANDGVVYAGNIGIFQESAFGSAKIQAQPIGDEVLYISPDQRKVRAMKFSLEGGGWYSRDLTFTAEHITAAGIEDLAFARDPFSTIVLRLRDGTLACCNYDRAAEVSGWWTAGAGGSLVKALSVLNTSDGDEVWALASRGDTVNSILRLPLYESDAARLDLLSGPWAVTAPAVSGTAEYDSVTGRLWLSDPLLPTDEGLTGFRIRVGGSTYRVGTLLGGPVDGYHAAEATVLTGPTATVAATADWEWLEDFAAISSPGIRECPFNVGDAVVLFDVATSARVEYTLTSRDLAAVPKGAATEYMLGQAINCEAETLPVEGVNPAGTSQGMLIHFTDITARIVDSVPPLLNGKRASEGRPFSVPLDEVEPRVSADVGVKNVSISRGGVITIVQDLPFRTEVCALYGQAKANKV